MDVLYGIGLVFAVPAVYILIPHWIKRIQKRRSCRTVRSSGRIALTFDDGPDARTTLKIIRLLKEANADATFFIDTSRALEHKDIIDTIKSSGLGLGYHCHYHHHPWNTNPFEYRKQLRKGLDLFKEISGVSEGILYRPTYGKLNLFTVLFIWRHKLIPVYWSLDSWDYKSVSGKRIARSVLERITAGDIVLFHDGRQDGGESVNVTIEALSEILRSPKGRDAVWYSFREISGN